VAAAKNYSESKPTVKNLQLKDVVI